MRDRLIELLLKCDNENEVLTCFHERPKKKQSAEILADHLLANGVIVPPCKIGDTVYYITGIHNTLVKKANVEEIYFGEGGFAYHLCSDYIYFTVQQEEIYFTETEAQKALKGGAE